jgi:hypothetical protein
VKGTWHDRGACIGGKHGSTDAYLFDDLNDIFTNHRNAPVWALVVTPSVGAFRSFVRRALYIGGVADLGSHLFG